MKSAVITYLVCGGKEVFQRRAEAATIAWMRHQTTAYDDMTIPREKGKRREVRRMLAKRSKHLLQQYRQAGSAMTPLDPTDPAKASKTADGSD